MGDTASPKEKAKTDRNDRQGGRKSKGFADSSNAASKAYAQSQGAISDEEKLKKLSKARRLMRQSTIDIIAEIRTLRNGKKSLPKEERQALRAQRQKVREEKKAARKSAKAAAAAETKPAKVKAKA